MNTIGSRIAAAREARGWTARELERKAGAGNHAIANYEKDAWLPRTDTLARISEALGVSLNWLVFGNHPPKADRQLMARLIANEKKQEG